MANELFYEYLKEKNIQEPHDKKEFIPSVEIFLCGSAIMRLSLFSSKQCIIKQLLHSVFVISGIIKVSVSVISLSLRLRLITLTSTLIIPDITKTSSNSCLIFPNFQTRIETKKINGSHRFTEIKVQKTCTLYLVIDWNLARYPGRTYCVQKWKKKWISKIWSWGHFTV